MNKIQTRDVLHVPVPFSCYSIGHYSCKKNWRQVSAGVHNKFVQIIWGISGVGEVTIFNQKFQINPGDVIWYLPGENHEYATISSEEWNYRWITFDGPLAAATMLAYDYPRYIENAGCCPCEIFEKIEELLPKNSESNARIMPALILELLAKIGNNNSPTFTKAQLVTRFVELVKNNFADATLNVEAISDILGVHRTTLSRVVTKQLKRSPHQYLVSFRAQYGLTLLKGTDLPISKIAEKCGFPNKSHFTSIIQKSVKMSPTMYRLSNNKIDEEI